MCWGEEEAILFITADGVDLAKIEPVDGGIAATFPR